MLFRFKTSAVSSIGSLFSSNSTQRTQDTDEFEMFSDLARNPSNFLKKSQSQNRLSDSRCIAMNLARNGQSCRDVLSTVSVSRVTASPTFTVSDLDKTPPLTPDLAGDILLSPCTTESNEQSEYQDDDTVYYTHKEEDDAYCGAKSQEIKEGKKAERPICYDTLISDITNGASLVYPQTGSQDSDEWYGLEYTLELSCRDRRMSDDYGSDVGEHSRSRKSWAAIHQGRIHPFFEDERYYQWKNWHRYLDRLDERRKHKKGLDFKARSKDLACLYVNEMRVRKWLYLQIVDEYDVVADGMSVKEHLAVLAERRPDPYFPPVKHDFAWVLKRSRSCACVREVCVMPGVV